MRLRTRMTGVTLIELMVALAIGSVLILGLVQVFAASRTAYVTSEGMGRVQENARFAVDFLQRDIRMAGHFGCVNDQAHWVKTPDDLMSHFGTTAATDPTNFNVSIHGYEATNTAPDQSVTIGSAAAGWSPALPAGIAALNPLPGSDIIELRYLDNEGIPVTALTPSGSDTIVSFPAARRDALTNDGDATPTMFGVADCANADVFPAGLVNLVGGTLTSDDAEFSARYTAQPSGQTLLYRAESAVYYVAANPAGVPALYRARFDGAAWVPEELVEGIESLQFLYGRDATAVISPATPPAGTVDRQDTAQTLANDANEWRRVALVQVGLLARSPDPAASAAAAEDAQQPHVLGVRFAPSAAGDTFYRSSYEVTVALRNRLFGN